MNTCSVESCPDPARTKGMCPKHYQRMRRSGHPLMVRRDCRDCGKEFNYEATNGRRRFFCEQCAERHTRLKNARYAHRQSVAISEEPEFYVRLQAYRFRSNIRRYGITPEQFDQMLHDQSGLCAICGDKPDPDGRGAYARLHIDHCHATGEVRSLLCGRCNQGLGYFRDDPNRLAAAAQYLMAHQSEQIEEIPCASA